MSISDKCDAHRSMLQEKLEIVGRESHRIILTEVDLIQCLRNYKIR